LKPDAGLWPREFLEHRVRLACLEGDAVKIAEAERILWEWLS
jgi:hypothetical protein